MTKFTKLIAAVALLWLVAAQATPLMAQQYDFTVGQLYYKITDAAKREVAVVREISDYPYNNNKPTGAITIPATVVNGGNTYSVTSVGVGAFYGCTELTAINIPNSVTSIGARVFYGCRGLTSINIPNGVTKIEYDTFSGCEGLTSIDIPNGVTSIGAEAFYGCSGLTSINIPSGVTTIGGFAFEGCSGLTSINIPSGVTEIEKGTFSGCKGLTSINIPSGVTSIGNSAFYDCSGLTSINLPSALDSIGSKKFNSYDKGVFENCTGLTSINIPSGVTSIGNSAFSGCTGLTSINIPSGITKIEAGTFSGCTGLTSINIPSGITKIEAGTFSGCTGLTSINIPNSVTSIGGNDSQGSGAFEGCKGLTSINIPSGVTTIGGFAFEGCSGLTSINIPSSVTTIGWYAFCGCTGLKSVTVGWQTPLAMGSTVFEVVTLNNVKLIVPRGTKAAYRAAEVWKEFNPIIADVKHTITYNQSANGTFKVKNGTQEIASGSTVEDETILTIEATPDQHYKLDSIRVNGKRLDKLSITVEEDTRIEAFFGKEKYTVKYNNPYGGKLYVIKGTDIVTSGEGVEYGTELTVKTAPDAGFKLKSLTLNGQTIPDNYKFTISKPVTIEVVFTSVGTGLDETSAAAGIVVYPNPVVDILRIATDTPIRTIRVFNIYGREVARATDTDRIDLSHLPAGVYTVRADGKTAKVVKK